MAHDASPSVLSGGSVRYSITVPGLSETPPDDWLETNMVTPDYFRVLGMQLIRGRLFQPSDRAGAPAVVLINDVAGRPYTCRPISFCTAAKRRLARSLCGRRATHGPLRQPFAIRAIGPRMALGASPWVVMGSVLRSALKRVALGVIIGWSGAWGASNALQSFVFGVRSTDPTVYIAVGAFLAFVGFAAALVPAVRAARLDPLMSLRHE